MYLISLFWGWADSSYPKQIEDHTDGDTIDLDTDPSVEMRSQMDHEQHMKLVQNDPT